MHTHIRTCTHTGMGTKTRRGERHRYRKGMVVSLEGGRVETCESIGIGTDADTDGRGGNAERKEGERERSSDFSPFFSLSDLLRPNKMNIPLVVGRRWSSVVGRRSSVVGRRRGRWLGSNGERSHIFRPSCPPPFRRPCFPPLHHPPTQSVYESLITVDYVDAIANPPDENLRLVPSDPYLASQCRYWADKLNRECCSPYYGVLVRTEEGERKAHFDKLVTGLRAFSREIERNGSDGRGFLGGGRLSSVDVSLMPWAYRYVPRCFTTPGGAGGCSVEW